MGPVNPNLYRASQKKELLIAAQDDLTTQYEKLYQSAKRRAAKAGIPFDLSRRQLNALIAHSGGKCGYTNITFSNETIGYLRYRPFAPSIDRIDSSGGYNFENCFLVCAAVNMAKGPQHIDLMHTLMLEYARAQGATIPDDLVVDRAEDRWMY